MKLEDITLNHIKILKTVDDCHSFSKAAKKLGYSQPLISKKIKQLEDYFGADLVTRSPGAVRLTSKGRKLVSQTNDIFEGIEDLQREFQISFSSTGESITVGLSPLLAEAWFEKYVHRFNLCFPNKEIEPEITLEDGFSSNPGSPAFDLLINNSSAYHKGHPCNRLQSYRLLLIDFNPNSNCRETDVINVKEIDFSNIILLEEIHRDLLKNRYITSLSLSNATILNSYADSLKIAAQEQKSTILPEFCLTAIRESYSVATAFISDAGEYGIYIHVPSLSELLILAEGLVRSFWLDQDKLEENHQPKFRLNKRTYHDINTLRLGIQRDSIGQVIAGYGVKYISEMLQISSSELPTHSDVNIDQEFDLQICLCSSGELMNRQMKRGELDICILDDISLLNNGSYFFDDLSFGSKLIGIASYNLLGQDISIIIPKSSNITSVYELKGKRISTLFGSNSHRFIITVLDSCGIDVNIDCTLIDEDPRTASSSLANGSIDAHVCCETFADLLEEYNFSKRLEQTQNLNIRLPSLRGIVCRSQFIRENPKYIVAFLHNLVIANHWFLNHSVEAINILGRLVNLNTSQVLKFFSSEYGTRIDPTLKPQWSWLLKTLNRRLEGKYGISKFDVDFWIDDYFLRLTYNLLGLDYHFQQVSFSSELSKSYFADEKFSKYMEFIDAQIAL